MIEFEFSVTEIPSEIFPLGKVHATLLQLEYLKLTKSEAARLRAMAVSGADVHHVVSKLYESKSERVERQRHFLKIAKIGKFKRPKLSRPDAEDISPWCDERKMCCIRYVSWETTITASCYGKPAVSRIKIFKQLIGLHDQEWNALNLQVNGQGVAFEDLDIETEAPIFRAEILFFLKA